MGLLNKIMLTITLLLLAQIAFPQGRQKADLKNDLLAKSVTQKAVGWTLPGVGIGTAIAGGIVQHEANEKQYGFDLLAP